MPSSPAAAIGLGGGLRRIPSWKDARRRKLVETLQDMAVEPDMAEQAADATGGDDLNAALEWVEQQGGSAQPHLMVGVGGRERLGSGSSSGSASEEGSVRSTDSEGSSRKRLRVWNSASSSYESVFNAIGTDDEDERTIEMFKSPLRRTKTLHGRSMSDGRLKLSFC